MNNAQTRMSYECFLNNIIQMKTLSDALNDDWKLEGNMDEQYTSYLKKKVTNEFTINSRTNLPIKNESEIEIVEYFERSVFFYEYHVAYSISYEVPILCLNIWNTDGKRLTMEEAWTHFDNNFVDKNMYSVLTQQDHPVLQTPFLLLHPCRTNELLNNFFLMSKNPVVSWLSTVGPAVKLKISNEYETLTKQD